MTGRIILEGGEVRDKEKTRTRRAGDGGGATAGKANRRWVQARKVNGANGANGAKGAMFRNDFFYVPQVTAEAPKQTAAPNRRPRPRPRPSPAPPPPPHTSAHVLYATDVRIHLLLPGLPWLLSEAKDRGSQEKRCWFERTELYD